MYRMLRKNKKALPLHSRHCYFEAAPSIFIYVDIRNISEETVDVVGQGLAVVIVGNIRDVEIRIHALIDIIEGTVLQEGHAVVAGHMLRMRTTQLS